MSVFIENEYTIKSSSHPADVHYNLSLYGKADNFTHESEIGPQVIHVYGIRNKGPSDIVEAVAYFLWPSYTLAGEHLLYLLEQPETLGNIKCDHVKDVNIENIALDRKKKSFLDPHAEIGIQAGLHSESGSSASSSNASSHSSSSSNSFSEETYTSSSGFSLSSSHRKIVTEEERKRIEEEILKREKEEAAKATGDGSFRQNQRSKNKVVDESSHYSSNGGRLVSESHSRPVYLEERGRVEISRVPVVSESSYFHQGSRKQNGSQSERRQGASHRVGSGGHSYYEEKEVRSNTTWRTGQNPKTSTTTKWKTVEDGVAKSGTSSQVESGSTGGNINLANLDLSSVGNRKYTVGGDRLYAEEKHYEKNTTWDSRDGVPKVSESSNWKINKDGVITSGSSKKGSQLDDRIDTRDGRMSVATGGSRDISQTHYQSSSSRSRGNVEQDVEVSQGSKHSQNWNARDMSASYDEKTSVSHPLKSRNDSRTVYSEERFHTRTSAHGEPGIGNRRTHDQSGEERTSYTQNQFVDGNRRSEVHLDGQRSGPKRTDGKHKIHWSSEQSEVGTGVTTTVDGSVKVDGEGVYNQGSRQGAKSYSEERHHEWNTTWSSADGGKPKTTELTSWKINADGSVSNGSNIGTYEGTPRIDKNLHKHIAVTNVGSGGIDLEQNFVRTGKEGTVYSEEKETSYNTTWDSVRGGRPVTHQHSTWKINKDGKISAGSSSDTYEGTAPTFQDGISNVQVGSSHQSRKHGSNYESRHLESEKKKIDSAFGEGHGDMSSSHDISNQRQGHHGSGSSVHESSSHHHGHHSENVGYDGSWHQQGHSSGTSDYDSSIKQQDYDRHLNHHASGTSETRRHEGSGSHYGTRHESSRQHSGTTNINVGDLLKGAEASGSQAGSFNNFGEIARGPGDGVARTYGLDLGMYSETRDHSGGHGTINEGEIRSTHHSSERHGGSTSRAASAQEASSGYSYRNSDRLEGYGDSGRSHSSWSSSYSSATADGDRPQHGGAYGIRKVSEDSYHGKLSDEATRGKFQLYPRYKRDASEDLEKSLSCGPTECSRIKCTLGPLKKDEEVWVAIRSRVWVPTMKKLSTNVEVGLSSLVAAKVTKLPHIGTPDVVTTHTHEVHSKIMPPETAVKPDIIPLWIVVVSACAGAIILMLLVYLLYKCGFFKRNRPSSAPEKQPLNRNGHYHGDEAL